MLNIKLIKYNIMQKFLFKLVIVVTKSAPDLLTPCGCPCICHEPLKCSFRIRVSECNSFVFCCVFSIITLCFLVNENPHTCHA